MIGSRNSVGIGILGATGYAGAELLRLLAEHPRAVVRALGSRQHAGEVVSALLPGLPHLDAKLIDDATSPTHLRDMGVDVLFAALPHGAFAGRAAAFLDAGIKLIDLSADFRLRDAASYPTYYNLEHPAPTLLPRAVYGLTEWCGSELEDAALIANPGCYATAISLALLPVINAKVTSSAPIIVNAVSGISGAGRTPKLNTHFVESASSITPYKVGESHQHLGELRQTLGHASGAPPLVFNPHLAPMARGILASISVPLSRPMSIEEVRDVYARAYAAKPFVNLLHGDALPETRHVRGSNRCDLALRVVVDGHMLLVFSAIDNLIKGAAGQAVQNFNKQQGWDETLGLSRGGWSCA